MTKSEKVSYSHTITYWHVKISFQKKSSGYLSFSHKIQKESSFFNRGKNQNETVQWTNISFHEETTNYLEIYQDIERIKEEANTKEQKKNVYENSTIDRFFFINNNR